MRILQISNRIPFPPKDGGAIATYNLTKAFHQLGQQVTLFALNTKKHHVNVADLPKDDFAGFADIRSADIDAGVKPLEAFLNLFTGASYNIMRFYSKEANDKLISLLEEKKFDIIQLEGPFLGPYLNTIRKHSDAKVVMRAHNVEYVIWERMANKSKFGIKKWYLGLLAKRLKKYELGLLNQLDAIIPISAQDQQLFQKFTNKPLFTATAGVNDTLLNQPLTHPENTTIFHLGSLDWMPNQEAVQWFIKDIWPLIRRKSPNHSFHVAGRNMPEWMNNLSGDGVNILGEIPDAVAFMQSHAIMVVPLLSGSGMRLKILEGMGLGKCIVSTSIGAEGIDYEDGKNILIADTAEAFAKQVLKCLTNENLVNEIGQEARELIKQKYTNKQIVQGLLSFYEKLLDNQKIPAAEW